MGEKANILLVDDHRENLTALATTLADLNQNLVLASSGEEALRHLLKQDFAVIILDVMMPFLDGFETAALIRQRDRSQYTPIIFLTAQGTDEDQMRQGYRLGAVDYLLKPFNTEVLRWKVAVFVDLYLKTQAAQHYAEIDRLNDELAAANRELQVSASRMQELYDISRRIGQASSSREVVDALMSSSYLRDASLANLLIFDEPQQGNQPPAGGSAEAPWRRDETIPDLSGSPFALHEYQLASILSREEPVIIDDVMSDPRLNRLDRELLGSLHATSLIQFPLIASGLWFGVFVIHWDTLHSTSEEDVRHMRGPVDQAAAAVYSMLLLRAEAAARHAAETANALKLKFLAMISHELRTPLTSIKGFSSSLLQSDVQWDVENQQDFLEIINREADNLANLVEQLLDMTALQAGSLRIEQRAEHFESIVADAMPRLVTLAEDHELLVDMADDLPPIQADRLRITQVLTNLVGNACRYSPSHSQVGISVRAENGNLEVDVTDQGLGIPALEREAVFEAFRQADNRPSKARGLGLGLAIAKGIVEAHGGSIWVRDSSSTGTTISFTLPAEQDMESP